MAETSSKNVLSQEPPLSGHPPSLYNTANIPPSRDIGRIISLISGVLVMAGFIAPWLTKSNIDGVLILPLLLGSALYDGSAIGESPTALPYMLNYLFWEISLIGVFVCGILLIVWGIAGQRGTPPKRYGIKRLAAGLIGLTLLFASLFLFLIIGDNKFVGNPTIGFWLTSIGLTGGIVGGILSRSK